MVEDPGKVRGLWLQLVGHGDEGDHQDRDDDEVVVRDGDREVEEDVGECDQPPGTAEAHRVFEGVSTERGRQREVLRAVDSDQGEEDGACGEADGPRPMSVVQEYYCKWSGHRQVLQEPDDAEVGVGEAGLQEVDAVAVGELGERAEGAGGEEVGGQAGPGEEGIGHEPECGGREGDAEGGMNAEVRHPSEDGSQLQQEVELHLPTIRRIFGGGILGRPGIMALRCKNE